MNNKERGHWFSPRLVDGQIYDTELHDSRLTSVCRQENGMLVLTFLAENGTFVSISVPGSAHPVLIGTGYVVPIIVSGVYVRGRSESVEDFEGLFGEENLDWLERILASNGSRATWYLIIDPSVGETVIIAAEGEPTTCLFCACAERMDLLPADM